MAKRRHRFPDGRRFELSQIPDGRWKVQNLDDKRGWSSARPAVRNLLREGMGGRVSERDRSGTPQWRHHRPTT